MRRNPPGTRNVQAPWGRVGEDEAVMPAKDGAGESPPPPRPQGSRPPQPPRHAGGGAVAAGPGRLRSLADADGDRNPPWLQEIRRCQERITAANGPGSYYATYRDAEIAYWRHIPQWILEVKEGGDSVARCLDIGSAYGTLALFCRNVFGCDVYVTDFTDAFLNPGLLKESGIRFAVNNFELDELPWGGDTKFDIVILTEVLEHFNLHPVNTLKKIHSLLSDNGRLFLSTPDSSEWGVVTKYYPSLAALPTSKSDDLEPIDDHVWQYSEAELLFVLDEAGFYLERLAYSPGTDARHFNLCLRKSFASVPEQYIQTATDARFRVIDYLRSNLGDTASRA